MLPLHLNKRLPQLSSCRLNEVGQEAGTAMFAHSGWRSPQCSVLCLFHLRIPPESQSWAWLCVLFLSGPQDESIASYKPKEHVLFCKESDNIYILIFWSRNLLCVDFRETTMTIILNKKKTLNDFYILVCVFCYSYAGQSRKKTYLEQQLCITEFPSILYLSSMPQFIWWMLPF